MAKAKQPTAQEQAGEQVDQPQLDAEEQLSADAAPDAVIEGDATPAPSKALVKARVLIDGALGKCNDVIEIAADQVKVLEGMIDTAPEAVAYAETLKKA